ncbi:unnamed protein product [Caenorhabditis auriculariae]|uniref:Uncharacterized protein n=1 Tax=Caenorhabditis auriculariae TaxID=2777116 RepID=A0A8S1GZ69_9PELO|nr:unnamed protein product [Caenorhabditis auriculariae]
MVSACFAQWDSPYGMMGGGSPYGPGSVYGPYGPYGGPMPPPGMMSPYGPPMMGGRRMARLQAMQMMMGPQEGVGGGNFAQNMLKGAMMGAMLGAFEG